MNDNDANKMIEHNRNVYNIIATDYVNKRSLYCDEWQSLFTFAKEGHKILDLGCGFGRLYNILQKKQVDYVGVDQSAGQLALAREMFPQAQFVEAEMTKLSFEDQYFDVIYCLRAFHHLPTVESRMMALGEMKRVLKKDGTVVMTNWNLYSDWGKKKFPENRGDKNGDFMIPWKDNDGKVLGDRYYHGFTIEELNDLFKKAGLNILEEFYVRKNEKCGIEEAEDVVTVATY